MQRKVKIGDIATLITKGTTPTSIGYSFIDNGINFIKIESLNDQGGFVTEKFAFINEECNEKMKRSQLQENDVLFSIAGAIGKKAIVTNEVLPANTNQALAIIRIPEGKINYQYLLYALESNSIKEQFEKQKQGVAQLNLSLQDIGDLEITVVSNEEQKEIVDVIGTVDTLIEKRKQQLQKLDELIKARFVEMFGMPDEDDCNGEKTILAEHLDVVGGYAFKSDKFIDSGIPVLRIGNINTGKFLPINLVFWNNDETLQKYKVLPGDLVMSLTGTVGKDDYGNVCILDESYQEYYLNQRNAKLVLKQTLNKYYLAELLKFSQVKKKLTGISRGVRQANISNKDILELQVYVPPIELQNQFGDFVQQIDKSKLSVQKSLEKLEFLKKALMQKYFG